MGGSVVPGLMNSPKQLEGWVPSAKANNARMPPSPVKRRPSIEAGAKGKAFAVYCCAKETSCVTGWKSTQNRPNDEPKVVVRPACVRAPVVPSTRYDVTSLLKSPA